MYIKKIMNTKNFYLIHEQDEERMGFELVTCIQGVCRI